MTDRPTPDASAGEPGAPSGNGAPPIGEPIPTTRQRNVVGLVAFIVAVVGFIFACIPGALIVGWVLLPIAFILGIVGLVLPNRKKAFALTGLIISVVGTVVAIIVFVAVVASSVSNALGGDDDPVANATPTGSASAPASDGGTTDAAQKSSFVDGVLTTPELKIEITEHRVIAVGQPGNEYGDKPVIAFYYKTTNLTDKKGVNASTAFLFNISAYQDTNPNADNELEVGLLPDSRFGDTQLEDIKKGGTVENAISYELDDLTTPVELRASELFASKPIGTVSYAIG